MAKARQTLAVRRARLQSVNTQAMSFLGLSPFEQKPVSEALKGRHKVAGGGAPSGTTGKSS
jgi:hypothetical protein